MVTKADKEQTIKKGEYRNSNSNSNQPHELDSSHPTTRTNRELFINSVSQAVLADRNKDYAEPEDSFELIGQLWQFYLANKASPTITLVDVALMMDMVKTARIMKNPFHLDSWIDKAGYAACAGGIIMTSLDRDGTY